ncbi:methyltransferase domain-containing protein [Aeromicrobium sp. CF4.19]|uniref:class I SAM-dependent methyltransferase n=1 Tax=Aeromicrobium sp. CF4.19 TaxID=3373082 RepID=UPI003EE73218
MVEALTAESATGWVAGRAEEFPVRVELCLNDLVVTTTRADHPSDLNSTGSIKGFRFALNDLWSYVSASDQVSFRVDGEPVPIAGEGIFVSGDSEAEFTVQDLQDKFAEGFVFDRTGRLKLSKKLDTQWQSQVVGLYERVAGVVKTATGYDIFVFYGSLLGQVRENGFIGHDDDFDAAYVSKHVDGATVAKELRDVAFALIDAGMDVECHYSALHVHDSADPDVRIDLFHTYFDPDDNLALPWGRASESEFRRTDWLGIAEGEMAGHKVAVPVSAEKLVAHLYGTNWRIPQAGFAWKEARTTRDRSGMTTQSDRESVYWANFYARNEFTSGSTFFEAIDARRDIPSTVLDIGSGDGRDSFAFAKAGRLAVGIDRSLVGVEHATRRADRAGLGDRLSFRACDVTDLASLQELIEGARAQAGGGALLFYMRFFLHSIPKDAQEGLMETLAACARRGDFLAAEFRTEADKAKNKTYGDHYRRFQNGPEFGRLLGQRYGFVVLEQQEGTGLSIYKDEDPALYRVVARKGNSPSTVWLRGGRFMRRPLHHAKKLLSRAR